MKKIYIFFILIIIVIVLIYTIFIRYNQDSKNEFINCINKTQDIIPGEWQSIDSDYPAILTLTLDRNGKFIYKTQHKTEDLQYELEGNWELTEKNDAIKLHFTELNEPWEKILSDENLLQKYPSVVHKSLEKKEISFLVDYLNNEQDSDCKAERYGIDIFNVYLYKK